MQPMQFFPVKEPADVLEYAYDASSWLTDDGSALIACDVTSDRSLTVANVMLEGDAGTPTRVVVTIGGGVSGTVPVIVFTLRMANGDVHTVPLQVPVQTRVPAGLTAFLPATGLVTIGGMSVQIGGAPATLG